MKLKNINTKFLGKNILYYDEIDSTQTKIWKLIEDKKAPNGTLVIADIQTNGKGTHGRTWYTDEKGNIAFSFYIETDCNVKKMEGITTEIAKIIVNIFKDKYKISLQIKQPNDIIFNNKKIGGILTQSKVSSQNMKCLVIGIGINTKKEKFNNELKDIATSIKKEFNIEVNTEEFISEFCNCFEKEIINRKIV